MSFVNFQFLMVFIVASCFPLQFRSQMHEIKLEELEAHMRIEKRQVVVFFHTEWCKYCKAMELGSFKKDEVVKILDDSYYFISINAEDENDIDFLGQLYHWRRTGKFSGYHEILSVFFGKDPVAYPSVFILDSSYHILSKNESFLSPHQLIELLDYYKLSS